MEKLTRLTTDQRESLTAYLDGELDDDHTRQIETVLTQSTVARNDIEVLAKTYELLDHLPKARASESFSEKTLATARLSDVRTDYRQTAWYRTARDLGRHMVWTGILFLVAGLGYSIARYRVPQPEDALLDNLELIRRLNDYQEVRDGQFLQQLEKSTDLLNDLKVETDRVARE